MLSPPRGGMRKASIRPLSVLLRDELAHVPHASDERHVLDQQQHQPQCRDAVPRRGHAVRHKARYNQYHPCAGPMGKRWAQRREASGEQRRKEDNKERETGRPRR